jgi:hypothetical protein
MRNHSFPKLGACPRIEAVARDSHFESNIRPYLTKMIEIMGQKGFSAVGPLFSDRLLSYESTKQGYVCCYTH